MVALFFSYASFLHHLILLLVLDKIKYCNTLEKDREAANNSENDPKSKLRQPITSHLCGKPKQQILKNYTEETDVHLMHQHEGKPVQ